MPVTVVAELGNESDPLRTAVQHTWDIHVAD